MVCLIVHWELQLICECIHKHTHFLPPHTHTSYTHKHTPPPTSLPSSLTPPLVLARVQAVELRDGGWCVEAEPPGRQERPLCLRMEILPLNESCLTTVHGAARKMWIN